MIYDYVQMRSFAEVVIEIRIGFLLRLGYIRINLALQEYVVSVSANFDNYTNDRSLCLCNV